jgi:hypothetical protein
VLARLQSQLHIQHTQLCAAESDNGVSVSLGFDMGSGNKIDYNDDDVLEAQGAAVTDADVAVSYAG